MTYEHLKLRGRSIRLAAHQEAKARNSQDSNPPAPTASEPAKAHASSDPKRPPYLFTQGDRDIAAYKATAAERRRVAAVFASAHSRGRERICATLLSHEKGWSAAEIIKQLPHLGMDTETSAKAANAGKISAEALAVWGAVLAQSSEDKGAAGSSKPTTGRSEVSALWERAIAANNQIMDRK